LRIPPMGCIILNFHLIRSPSRAWATMAFPSRSLGTSKRGNSPLF
jgi:hypothetical protein